MLSSRAPNSEVCPSQRASFPSRMSLISATAMYPPPRTTPQRSGCTRSKSTSESGRAQPARVLRTAWSTTKVAVAPIIVTAPRTVLLSPRSRRPRKRRPPSSGRPARLRRRSSLMTAMWTAPPRMTGVASQTACATDIRKRSPTGPMSAQHPQRPWEDADREGPREPDLVAVAEEGEWALALDPRLDRSPHAERPARYGPPEPHRGERREERSKRLGREECQLEDAGTGVR